MKFPVTKTIKLRLLDDPTKDMIKNLFYEIEGQLKIEGLGYTLFYVVMELVSNAVRANLKRFYFKQHGYSLTDPDSYQTGLTAFKRDYLRIDADISAAALDELDFQVTVRVDINNDRLLIFVENNIILLEEEEKRIRTKLASACEAKDIIEFSVMYGDETEGKGLGLAMIVLLIKDMGFDPGYFRVYPGDKKTVARLEFPLRKDYKPIRELHSA